MLVVMCYMHLCSALCATSTGGCCSNVKEGNIHSDKTCCSHTKQSATNDCQDFHLTFFNTTGQFTPDKNPDVIKPYASVVAVITPLFNLLPVEQSKNVLAFNVFHPPGKADIRISIRSFQI